MNRFLLVGSMLASLAVGCGGSQVEVGTSAAGAGGTGGAVTGAGASTSASNGAGSAPSTGAIATTSSNDSSSSVSGSGGAGGSAGPTCSGLSIGAGDSDEMVTSGPNNYAVHIHVPASYSPSKATSLVLAFHGFFESGTVIEGYSKLDALSDAHGFVVAYPSGQQGGWNAGACCGFPALNKIDDVKFVGDLIDHLETEFCVDKKRVFATGFSNGGMLSHRLACEMSDRIAAIGAVSGTIGIPTCTPSRPVPVLHVHGTGDPIVPFTGGGFGGAESVADTIAHWVANDSCTDAQPATVYSKGTASCTRYSMCEQGSAVELCTIQNGGHQWPDPAGDIDAGKLFVEFFEAHPMP